MNKTIDPEAGSRIQDLISENQNLYYQEGVFLKTCEDLGQGSEFEFWTRNLTSRSTLADIVDAVPEGLKGQFLKLYIYHSRRGLVV